MAIVAAISSGYGAAWLTARNDRQERFRDRMIEAADDFSQASSRALIAMRSAQEAHRLDRSSELTKTAVEAAWSARDEALALTARVDLLFAPKSAAGLGASSVVHLLGQGNQNLTEHGWSKVDQFLLGGNEKLQAFQRAAFDGIRSAAPPTASLKETVRQIARRK